MCAAYVCRSRGWRAVGWDLCKSLACISHTVALQCCADNRRCLRFAGQTLATLSNQSGSSEHVRYTCTLVWEEEDSHQEWKYQTGNWLYVQMFQRAFGGCSFWYFSKVWRFSITFPRFKIYRLSFNTRVLWWKKVWTILFDSLRHSCGAPVSPSAGCHGLSLYRGAQRSQWSPAVLCLHTHFPWTCERELISNKQHERRR